MTNYTRTPRRRSHREKRTGFNPGSASSRAEPRRSAERKPAGQRARKPRRGSQANGRKFEQFTMPPVMVRGAPFDFPVKTPKRDKARRRYDVSLNVPGAEMRLPSLPQVRIGWRLLSFLMVAGLGWALYTLWNSPEYRVQAAEVAGVQRLADADVAAVLDVEGEPIFAIQAARLKEQLVEAFPELASVSVAVDFPNSVQVTVEERQPILTWRQEGRTVLVDANGFGFPPRENSPPGPTLVVEAASAPPAELDTGDPEVQKPLLPVEMVSAILSMRGQAPDYTPILYNGTHGLGWRDRRGWEVYFGDVRDMGMKLNVYRALLTHFKEEGIKPVLVSVEHVHAPYYRMEQ